MSVFARFGDHLISVHYEIGQHMDGSGSYTVNVIDTVPVQLNLNTTGSTHTELGDIDWNVPMNIDLTPLDTSECGLEILAFNTPVGEFGGPEQTIYGWVIIQVLGHEMRPYSEGSH